MTQFAIYLLLIVSLGQAIRIHGLTKDLKIMNRWCLMQDELLAKARQRKEELND